MRKNLESQFKARFFSLRELMRKKFGSPSFSGLITIIAALMVVNIYLLLYSDQLSGVGDGSFYKDLVYAEAGMSFIALVSLGLWFRTLTVRLFALVDAAREMIASEHVLPQKNATKPKSREGIFAEMTELSQHMGDLHDRMVYFATLSGSISTMLDSLGQGILVIGPDGKCSSFYSKACEDLFEISPAGRTIAELLHIPENETDSFATWLDMLYSESIAFEDLADLAPKSFVGTKGRQINLDMRPIRNEQQKIEGILLIATDKTREFESEIKAKENREKVEMMLKITQDRELFRTLVKKCRSLISWLRQSTLYGMEQEFIGDFRRAVHTVKGAASAFFMTQIVNICHELETDFKDAEGLTKEQIIQRVQKFTVDFEFELTSVLVRHAGLLGQRFESDGPVRVHALQSLLEFHSLMDTSLQADIPTLREQFFQEFICIPLREAFSGFNGRLQDLSEKLGKKVGPLRMTGVDLRISKESNDDILFNLVHIFNNIVDHGIEAPEERRAVGKPPVGRVTTDVLTNVDRKGRGWVEIRISDDGRGVSPSRVREKLKRLGKDSANESDLEVIQHIFDADFSTRDEVSELSGRGVGLNALKIAITDKNGQVIVMPSKPYGTTFIIRIPQEIFCGTVGNNFEKVSAAA